MPTDRPPLSRSFSGPLTVAVARFMLAQMRRLEETHIDVGARWEFLRRLMERIAEGEP
jgi:hypothetical protein